MTASLSGPPAFLQHFSITQKETATGHPAVAEVTGGPFIIPGVEKPHMQVVI